MSTLHRRVWLGLIGVLALIGLAVALAWMQSRQADISAPAQPQVIESATPVSQVTTDLATAAPIQTAPPTTKPAPTLQPTALSGSYTVLEGDTLWSVAVKFGLSLDQVVAANPGLNPDLIQPGQVIQLPAPGALLATVTASAAGTPEPSIAATASISPTFQFNARVKPDADRLRLRALPNTDGAVLRKLDMQTALLVIGRTSDGVWLQVTLADGQSGWVMAQFVDGPNDPNVPTLAVTAAPTVITKLDVQPGNPSPLSTAGLPRPEAYLLNFTTRAIDIYRAGLRMGNQAKVFTLVGDSNTANPAFFEAFDAGNYNLDQYGYLDDTLRYYQGNFKLTSVAAVGGFNTTRLWEPERADPAKCMPGEGSLACEYRIKKPSVALILIGSNDRPLWREFEDNYRQIVEYTISQGILPVLITKGDDTETQYGGPSGHINSIIRKLSSDYSVPLLDLRLAIDQFQMPNNGLEADNLHFSTPPDGLSTHFNPEHLRFGYTLRNLTALQALDAVRRLILEA